MAMVKGVHIERKENYLTKYLLLMDNKVIGEVHQYVDENKIHHTDVVYEEEKMMNALSERISELPYHQNAEFVDILCEMQSLEECFLRNKEHGFPLLFIPKRKEDELGVDILQMVEKFKTHQDYVNWRQSLGEKIIGTLVDDVNFFIVE